MPRKVILISDPGIDGAFAVCLALNDPDLEVLALAATPGNVSADQATQNIHILVGQIDPPRWPRLGVAPAVEFDVDGMALHGPGGLGGTSFPCAELHHAHQSDKLVCDLVRQYPNEITIVVMGPVTVLARALDRDGELPALVDRIICLGGSWHEPGNATAAAEFHFYCDPASARQVLQCGGPLTLIPLDVMRKLVLSPTDLLQLPASDSRTSGFLRQIVPFGIRATAGLYGIEGFHLKDVLGIAAAVMPGSVSVKPMPVDVETRGDLSRGVSIVDSRWGTTARPNVDLAVGIDVEAIRRYIDRTLSTAT